jgi:hypothetical protein
MSMEQQQQHFAHVRLASTKASQRDLWQRRLRMVRNAIAAWDLVVARQASPRFVGRLLTALLPSDVLATIDGRRWAFRYTLPLPQREAALARMDALIAAWMSGTGEGSADLAVVEETLVHDEKKKQKRQAAVPEARMLLLQRLLMTHQHKLAVTYCHTDPFSAPRGYQRRRSGGSELRTRYPVEKMNLVRAGVDVAFTHSYTTLKGEYLQRTVCLRFHLPHLRTTDGNAHVLHLAEPGADFDPTTLKARAALALAQAWRRFDTPKSYSHITEALFPNIADWLRDMSSSNREEEEEKEKEKDIHNASFSFGEPELAPAPAPNVNRISIKVETEMEMDIETSLADLLRRVPVPPAGAHVKHRIVIDLTNIDE